MISAVMFSLQLVVERQLCLQVHNNVIMANNQSKQKIIIHDIHSKATESDIEITELRVTTFLDRWMIFG